MTGDELTRLRRRLGLSQEGLARLLDVAFATVNRWEKGRSSGPRGPVLAMLTALEAAHQIEPELGSKLAAWFKRGNNVLWSRVFELARQHDAQTTKKARRGRK